MTKRDQVVIARALAVLDEVAADRKPPQSLHAVRLALHVLLPHCPETWPLTNFYDGVQQDNEIGRGQSMNAALNGIRLQLGKRGWKPAGSGLAVSPLTGAIFTRHIVGPGEDAGDVVETFAYIRCR